MERKVIFVWLFESNCNMDYQRCFFISSLSLYSWKVFLWIFFYFRVFLKNFPDFFRISLTFKFVELPCHKIARVGGIRRTQGIYWSFDLSGLIACKPSLAKTVSCFGIFKNSSSKIMMVKAFSNKTGYGLHFY